MEEAQNCTMHSSTCKLCDGENCNERKTFQECYACNNRNDPRCSRNPRSTSIITCPAYYSHCVTGIDKKGYTNRECVKDTHNVADELSTKFKIFQKCIDNRCNNEIFPDDRLRCFQCNGEKDCNAIDYNRMLPEPCKILSEYDQCFTYINKSKFAILWNEPEIELHSKKNFISLYSQYENVPRLLE